MECEFCLNHEQGDTLYESSYWDGGINFDYIRDIKYCPICGKKLNSEDEPQTDCKTCKHKDLEGCEEPCLECKGYDLYES